jgi:hypothetical protein
VRVIPLALRECLAGHDVVIPRQGVENDVSLVALKPIGRYDDKRMLFPFLFRNLLGDEFLEQGSLLLKKADYADRGAAVVFTRD